VVSGAQAWAVEGDDGGGENARRWQAAGGVKQLMLALFLSLWALAPFSTRALESSGYLDNLSTLAEGWGIYAPFSNQPCVIEFYANGSSTNGQFLGRVETKVSRPDVNSYFGISGIHGFSYAVPVSLWDGIPHSIYAYVTSPDGTLRYPLVQTPAMFMHPQLSMTHTNVQQLWFAPVVNTNAFLQLFSGSDDWQTARTKVSVFKVADHWLLAYRSFLNLTNMLSKLRTWHIDLGFESGAVKEWGCTANVTFAVTSQAMGLVTTNGGAVKWIAMDEPLLQTSACNCTDAGIITQTVAYVKLLREKSPGLIVGDIEPWPYFRYPRLTNWITGFSQQAGFDLAFLHLDVDLGIARGASPDLSILSEIPQIAAFCKSRGIPFGVIIWQSDVQSPLDSNQAFYDNSLYWAQILHSVSDMDHAIVQSWEQYPDQNVPDSQPYTFTRLLRDYTATIASVPFPNPGVEMFQPGQVSIHGRTGASYQIESVQNLRPPIPWQNAAIIKMDTPDTNWTDLVATNASKFYRVIGER
jgi:hypothetical protein